jgi:uncharacterized protein (DUF2267 family)
MEVAILTFPEFIREVQRRGRLGTTKEALMATDATLSALGGRIYTTAGEKIGANLVPQIREYLEVPYLGLNLGVEDFYSRVCLSAGIGLPTAKVLSAVVISVLGDAMAPGEIEEIRTRLPVEYKPLFAWREGMPLAA